MDYTIDKGWITQARKRVSPNFGPRPPGCETNLLVIHNISLPPGQYEGECIERFFCNELDWDLDPYFDEIRGVEVSSHLLIRRDGELIQFVSFFDRAWHAGRSCFKGRQECNDFSIGIELEGTDVDPYTPAQYDILVAVTAALLGEFTAMSEANIVGHCEIAPDRKTDPGPAFDWSLYRTALKNRGERV
jgi:AmpD protein